MSGRMPWAVIASPTDPELYAVKGAYLVADNLPLEDATLIAGAPDLLSAFRRAMPILERAESNSSGNPEFDYVGPRVASARWALDKVKGVL